MHQGLGGISWALNWRGWGGVPQVLAGRGDELCQPTRVVSLRALANWPGTCSSSHPSTKLTHLHQARCLEAEQERGSALSLWEGEPPGSQQVPRRSGLLPLCLPGGPSLLMTHWREGRSECADCVEAGAQGSPAGTVLHVCLLTPALYLLHLLASRRPSSDSQLASLPCLRWCAECSSTGVSSPVDSEPSDTRNRAPRVPRVSGTLGSICL